MSGHDDFNRKNAITLQRPFSYPYGYTSVIASIIALVALICSMSSTTRCDFIKVNIVDKQETHFHGMRSYDEDHWYSFGLWVREEQETPGVCTEYTENEVAVLFDSKWNGARIASIMADIFAIISCLLVFLSACIRTDRRLWKIIGFFCLMCSLMEALSLLVLGSTLCLDISECQVDRGAAINLAASCLWSACALAVAMFPEPSNGMSAPDIDHAVVAPPGSTVRTEITAPDGTVQTLIRSVNEDGLSSNIFSTKPEIV